MNTSYKVVYVSGGKQAYEHRLVWESHHGPIPAGHHVHHKNGDKRDNRIENLELLSSFEHHKQHFLEHGATEEHKQRAAEILKSTWAAMPMLKLKCVECGSEFEKKKHTRHGAAQYCSSVCRGRHYYHTKYKSTLQARKLQEEVAA
ncbi:MAG: HNH endonuclease [Betaproteobacteria bacterium]|nr:HNH endonuclease [Betaproteobacteria bacterium]